MNAREGVKLLRRIVARWPNTGEVRLATLGPEPVPTMAWTRITPTGSRSPTRSGSGGECFRQYSVHTTFSAQNRFGATIRYELDTWIYNSATHKDHWKRFKLSIVDPALRCGDRNRVLFDADPADAQKATACHHARRLDPGIHEVAVKTPHRQPARFMTTTNRRGITV